MNHRRITAIRYTGWITAILLLVSCGKEDDGALMEGPTPYPVVEIPLTTVTGYNAYPASLEGRVNSAVRAKVAGYITDVLVDEGEKVQKGQPLFRLETASLTQDAEAAYANVKAAEVEVEKLKPLVENGIISSVQLQTAEARLTQAKASFNSINANIDYATIKSPVDGSVGAIPFREGALVSPNDSQPLTVVTDVADIYAFFSMNERDYLNFLRTTEGVTLEEKISNLPPVELQLVNGEIYELTGRISTITGQVNESTGTVSFRATFPNPNRILSNGNSGRVRIPEVYENVAVVPEASTIEQQGRTYIYKVQGDTLAVSSSIDVVDRVDNLIVVGSGVDAGEKIVARGVGMLSNNAAILPEQVAFEDIANGLEIVFK